jgi:hypothetical protein
MTKKTYEWLPIETAPKDGTIVILWWGDGWAKSGMWFDGAWVNPDGNAFDMGDDPPTHWMSLSDRGIGVKD